MKSTAVLLVPVGAVTIGLCAAATPATASETNRYVYDARGRLVEVERTQPTVTVKTRYTHDRADNRIKKEITTIP
jgi:hypothetical protein